MTCLVLLPGMDATGSLFADFVDALRAQIKPIVVAYPSEQVLNYEQLETYVRERLPENEPFVLLGESFSGPIAISIAANAPRYLTGLILCCSFAKNPRPMLAALKPLTKLMQGFSAATLASPFLLGSYSTAALRRQLGEALKQVSSKVMQARLRAVIDVDVTEALKQVRVPIHYLRATRDQLVPQSASALISSIAPQTRVVNVDGPHMLLQAMPMIAASIVTDLIEQIRVNDPAKSALTKPATAPPSQY